MNYTILRPPAFMEWHAHKFLGKDILEKRKATILAEFPMDLLCLENFVKARVKEWKSAISDLE